MTPRRSFLRQMLVCCAGATILPGAVTYARRWNLARSGVIVPEFILGNPPYVTEWTEIYTGATMRRLMRAEYQRCLNALLQSTYCPESISASKIAEIAVNDGKAWLYDAA